MHDFTKETWIQANWRPTAAFVYLVICMMDFVAMPLLTLFFHQPFYAIMKDVSSLQPEVQKAVLVHAFDTWTPITIAGNGLFHIAFGAILGVSAWGRTSEKNERVKQLGEVSKASALNDNSNTTTLNSDPPEDTITSKTSRMKI